MKRCVSAVLLCAVSTLYAVGVKQEAPLDVRFDGRVGEKFDALVRERCLCDDALGLFYEETINAFRTHYDDTVNPKHGYWQNEYWGKNMLGLIAGATYTGNEKLKKELVVKAREFVKEFQRPDGAITTYKNVEFVVPKDKERTWMCWNLWGRKYTLWALLELYGISRDKFLLKAASKLLDQQIEMLDRLNLKVRDTGCFSGLPSLSVLKPVLMLYCETKDKKYLDYAKKLVAEMDDPDPSNPPPNLVRNAFTDSPVSGRYPVAACDVRRHTKAYELMSCLEGLVEYSRITGEKRPLEAAILTADRLVKDEINVMCSVGYGDRFASAVRRPNGYSEYCDVLHWIRLCRFLYETTGDAKHLDRLETAFLNAGLAGFYRSGKWATHCIRSHGFGHFPAPQQVGMKYHQCCIDNAPRLATTMSGIAVREKAGDVVEINLYVDLTTRFEDGKLEITGDYPVKDEVTLRLDVKRPRTILLRVPGWCGNMKVDGKKVEGPFVTLKPSSKGEWKISFEMPVTVFDRVKGAPVNPAECPAAESLFQAAWYHPLRVSPVRKDFAAYIMRGPLLLAKTSLLGVSDKEIFDFETVNCKNAKASLEPIDAKGAVWGAWKLTLTTPDGGKIETKVSDYATSADDTSDTAFSVWF